MVHMVSRRSFAAVVLAAILAAPMAWSQDAPPARVRGTIERIEGPVFVVKSRDGAELKIVLAENAVAVGVVKATLTDIKPGSFVGIAAMPQPDGTQRALEVLPRGDARDRRGTLPMGPSAQEHHDKCQCRARRHWGRWSNIDGQIQGRREEDHRPTRCPYRHLCAGRQG